MPETIIMVTGNLGFGQLHTATEEEQICFLKDKLTVDLRF